MQVIFGGSLKLIPLINCKLELKLKQTNHCVLSANGNDNDDTNSNAIIFTIKDIKLYAPALTLLAKDNKKLLSKGFERSVYLNEYKTKSQNRNTINRYRYFLESNFVGVNRLFVLVYSNQDDNANRYGARRQYPPKGIIQNYNAIIIAKKFYD